MINDARYDLAGCVVTSANDRLILKFLAPGFKEQSYNTVIHAVDLNNFEKVQLRANMTLRKPTEKYGIKTMGGLITRSNELCEATVREAVKSLARQFLTAKHTFNAPLYSITEVEFFGFDQVVIDGIYIRGVSANESGYFQVITIKGNPILSEVRQGIVCRLPIIPTNEQLEMTSSIRAGNSQDEDTIRKLLSLYLLENVDSRHQEVYINSAVYPELYNLTAIFEESGRWAIHTN